MITPEMIEAATSALRVRYVNIDVHHHARLILEAAETVRPKPEPAAWMAGTGHPKHINDLQSVRERQIYGERKPLYIEPPAQAEPVNSRLLDGMEKDLEEVIKERDEYHDIADQLADQIAAITDTDVGEHTSANNPWSNAMLAADEYLAKNFDPTMYASYLKGKFSTAFDALRMIAWQNKELWSRQCAKDALEKIAAAEQGSDHAA